MSLFDKIFGTYSEKELKKIQPITDSVIALESKYKEMSTDDLKAQTAALKLRL
ncbi:MAG: hypothetical protein RR424_07135, partial [Oscillospiraceae bacterium]